MKTTPILAAAFLTLSASAASADGHAMSATATMMGADGEARGTVTLTQTPHGVLIDAELNGVSSEGQGFHIHETGACEPDFKAAGGHYNPDGHGHGLNHEGGYHAGDLPNVFGDANGDVRVHIFTDDVTLGEGENSLMDEDGSAFILHAKPDTYGEDAGAGDRMACGVIEAG